MPSHYSGQQQYTDAGEHAQHLNNLEQRYFQIEKGRFGSTLEQFDLDGLGLFSERVNRRIVGCGQVSRGMVGIGWVSYSGGPPTSGGREITHRTVSTMRSGTEWIVHVPPYAEIRGITLTESEFDGLTEHLGRTINRRDSSVNVWSPAGETSLDAVRLLHERVGELRLHADRLTCPATRYALRKALLDDVIHAIEKLAPPRDDLTRLTYSEIVRRSQDYLLRHAGSPVTVLDLCKELRISRRTLQTSFRHITGQPPTDYLRAVRLCEVRRMLRNESATHMSIASIAARWGFVHLGNFANYYRRLFGELPSQTPRLGARA